MLLFGLGKLFYVAILLVNAVAILSEDRFLARIGWSNTPIEHPTSFGVASGGRDDGIKSKLVNLISSVRTLMRRARVSGWSLADTCGFVLVPLIVINTLVIVYELVLG